MQGSPFDSTPGTFDNQFFVESLLKGTALTGNGQGGEVMSPIPGEFRLQSDFAISRDSRTACEWQSLVSAYPGPLQFTLHCFILKFFLADHSSMVSKFETVMAKLAVVGQNPNALLDCSDVIPVPSAAKVQTGSFPPGKSKTDVQSAVRLHTSSIPPDIN